MIVTDVKLRDRSGTIRFESDPAICVHAWEAHLWEHGGAYCPRCGSTARWADDPRLQEILS